MEWLDRVAWTALLNAAVVIFGWATARLLGFGGLTARSILAAGTLAWAWLTLGMQLLGPLAALSRPALLAWGLVGAVPAALALWRCRLQGRPREPSSSAEGIPANKATWDWSATLSLAIVMWACLELGLTSLVFPVKVVSDGPIYHLHFAARWWREGRLSIVASPFGEAAAAYFPANGDLWFSWLMIGWNGDLLARVGQAPFLLVASVAVYQMCRTIGAVKPAATTATCAFASLVPLLMWSFEPIVDTMSAAGYLVAAAFLIDYARGPNTAPALLIAGLAAGLSLGTKMPSIVFVTPLVVFGCVLVMKRRGAMKHKLRHLILWLFSVTACACYWWLRNGILTGNPLYPAHLEFMGRVWLRGWYTTAAMAKSNFYIPREWWDALVDILISFVDFRLAPLWCAGLLGAWAIGKPKQPEDRWVWLCAVGAVVNVLLFWVFIPYRTQQRFMLHAFGLAAVPLALLLSRGLWLQRLVSILLVLHLLTPSNWPFPTRGDRAWWGLTGKIPTLVPPLIPLPTSSKALHELLSFDSRGVWLWKILSLGLCAALLSVFVARAIRSASRKDLRHAVLVGFVVVVVARFWLAFGSVGSSDRFPRFPEYFAAWNQLDNLTTGEGSRIAYAGTNLPYYLMGSHLQNQVEYVNIDAHRDWLMHDYHRAAARSGAPALWDSPRPGWDRIHPERSGWLDNLRAAGIRYLVVARVNPNDGPFNFADRERFPIERVWAEQLPEIFKPVYGQSPPDPNIKIYEIRKNP